VIDELKISLDAFAHTGILELGGHPLMVELLVRPFAERGHVPLAGAVLDVGQEIRTFADQVASPSEQIPGRAHFWGVDVGLRDHAAAQELGDLAGIHPIVLDLSAVNGFHIESVSKDERDLLAGTQVGEPVPGEDTFHGDDEIIAKGCDRLEERLGSGRHVPVKNDGALLIQDANVHRAGMKVDTAGIVVLVGVESHRSPPLWGKRVSNIPSIPKRYAEEEASMSITESSGPGIGALGCHAAGFGQLRARSDT